MSKIKVNNIESLAASGTITSNSNLDFQNSYSLINVSGVTAQNVTVLGTLTSAGFAPSGNLTSNGNFQVGSTSRFGVESTTGNTVISGTLSNAGAVNFGSTANIAGNTVVSGTTQLNGDLSVGSGPAKMTVAASTGNTVINGTLDVKGVISNSTGNVTVGDVFEVTDSSNSSSVSTGSIKTTGGLGVTLNATIGGDVNITSATTSTTTSTGSLKTAGGVGITENLNVGGVTILSNGTTSTTATSGALQVTGGVGIVENLNVSGITKELNTTDSTSTSTGALQVSGGVGIAKNLYVGELLNTKSITSINEFITCIVGTNPIGTEKFVMLSGNLTGTPQVQVIGSASDTPLAYWNNSSVSAAAGSTSSFIKRGIVDSTLTTTTIGQSVYCSSSGSLTLTVTNYLVGFAATTGANAKIYLNIGGSGGGSGLIDSYLSYSTISLANNAVDINLGETDSCSYRFFVKQDTRICGDINVLYKGAGIEPEVRIDTNSALVSIVKGTATSLNIYILGNTIKIENNNLGLGTIDLRLYKFQTT